MSTDKVSLYIQVANDIKEYIPSHALAAGDRLPSIQELCTLFSVSHATVRAALNLLTQEGVVESRPRQGIFVSQAKVARNSAQRENVIALLLSGDECAYEAGIIRGVMEQSLKGGYQVIVASNNSDVQIEAQQLEELSQQVSGVIVFPTHASGNYASYARLLEQGIPWVFIDRGVTGLAASLVATDNEYGGYLATRHLLEKGYRNIYAISGKPVSSIQERIQGVRRAFKEWGLPYSPDRVRSSPHYVHTVGYQLTQEILRERHNDEPLAIFVLDETLALPCYAALKEANRRIPEDVAVISYDDMNARFFDPPLSSIRQDPHRMGGEATKMLIDLIRTHKTVLPELRLKPQLIVRNSTDVALPANWADYSQIQSETFKHSLNGRHNRNRELATVASN
jgi:DNA-binding LacI/PurR family transcriptional regulator